MRYSRVFGGLFLCIAFFSIFWLYLSGRDIMTWEVKISDIEGAQGSNEYAVHHNLPSNLVGKQLAFHQIFEPRLISFDGYEKRPLLDNSTKTILLWTAWNGVKDTINYYFLRPGSISFTSYNCPNPNCQVTWDRSLLSVADAVLFNVRDIPDSNYKDIPERPQNNPNQRWIAYILEAPWLSLLKWTKFDGVFDWTMSYRNDSDIVVKYGFVGNRSTGEPDAEPGHPVPFSKRRSVVWFVSDCKTDSRREDYVKELQKHIDVDVYGKCGDKSCYPSQSSICYGDVLVKYKFYLSFENSLCKDYVTEKFFNILEYDVVPIVFGGAPYHEIAPKNSYISAMDYPKPKDLAAYLKKVGRTEKSYRQYFSWKSTHRAYLQPWTCSLCDKLHESVMPRTPAKTGLGKWWVDDAKCMRWTDSQFTRVKY